MSSRRAKDTRLEGAGVAARLRAATEVLEAVVRDRALLGELSVEGRARLLNAAADVFKPDLEQRRRGGEAGRRRGKAAKLQRDETGLAGSGIPGLRGRPGF